jgi:hypothetical protein
MTHQTRHLGTRELLLALAALIAALVAIGSQVRTAHADGTFGFSSATYSVTEGDAAAITITRTGGTENVTVSASTTNGTATSPTHYISPGTVNFIFTVPGSTSAILNVTTVEDLLTNANRTFTVNLTVPSGSTPGIVSAVVTIIDDDASPTYSYQSGTATFAEGTVAGAVTVLRSGATGAVQSVDCSVTGGTATAPDYTVVDGTANFGVGDTSATCTFTITSDGSGDAGETINLGFTNPQGGIAAGVSNQTMVITISEGATGTVQFSQSTYSVVEGVGTATFAVTRTGGSVGAISATCSTTVGPGTAIAGSDYSAVVAQALNWANGVTTTQYCSVAITSDLTAESSEQFGLSLSSANIGSPASATVTILDDDGTGVLQFSAASYSGAESGGPITVTVTRTGSSSGIVSVNYYTTTVGSTATVGTDYVAASGTLTWNSGDMTSKSFTVTPIADGLTEGTESVNLALGVASGGAVLGAQSTAVLYITDGTGIPVITSISPVSGPTTGGTALTIYGYNFLGATSVTVDGVACTSVAVAATVITCVTPIGAVGTAEVVVTTPLGSNTTTGTQNDYTYTTSTGPTVTSVSPASGPTGTTITVYGTNFTGATSVTVGGVSASFTTNSSTQITATVPAGLSAGVVDVRVTTPNGTSANTGADNFTVTATGETVSYTLYFRFTLLVWTGKNNIGVLSALKGLESPDVPATNDVSGSVGVVYRFNGATQTWEAYFPGADGVPGANDFTTLQNGGAYFVALKSGGQLTWTTLVGP